MIHQQEQSIRNSRSDQRLIKYSNEVYTMRTLQAFSNALQVNEGTLTVLFDITDSTILQYLPELVSLPEQFVSIELFPIGSYDMNQSCTDDHCTLYKTLLCGNDGTGIISIPYTTCILQAKQVNDNVIRNCAESSNLFPPSVISCFVIVPYTCHIMSVVYLRVSPHIVTLLLPVIICVYPTSEYFSNFPSNVFNPSTGAMSAKLEYVISDELVIILYNCSDIFTSEY